MEASRKRNIRDGKEFEKLFPPPSGIDRTIKKQADVADTMKLIQQALPEILWQAKKFAPRLKGKTLDETCENIWNFVYNHVQYKHDDYGVEQVRSFRRTWWDRFTGVDCDCYTVFIGCILFCLRIPHIARVTKYLKKPPEVPRWQHVYPIVPRNGNLDGPLNREDYIVLDCVKDEYDNEQPFLDKKDFYMRLEFLDGVDDDEQYAEADTEYTDEEIMDLMGLNDADPETVDLADLASIYDDEQMGNIFKKIGKGIKKVTKKVVEAHKKIAKKTIEVAKKGVRFAQRYLNPGSILIRNGILLGMKLNMFNLGGKLRWAYLTDAQAASKNMDLSALAHVRKMRQRLENFYVKSGGKVNNLTKAVLTGKGNKDKQVSLAGLDGLDDVYADMDEYNIVNSKIESLDDLAGLGDLGIVASTAVAAATGFLAALSKAVKGIKGLFKKGTPQDASFESDTDNATSEADVAKAETSTNSSQDESALLDQSFIDTSVPTTQTSPAPSAESQRIAASSAAPTQQYYEAEATTTDSGDDNSPVPLLPSSSSVTRRMDDAAVPAMQNASGNQAQPEGLVAKTTAWVKKNPVPAVLIAGAVIGGVVVATKMIGGKKAKDGLSGLPGSRKKHRKKKRRNKKVKTTEIKRIII